MRDTEKESQRHRQREKQAPYREPDEGIHPEAPGSRPEPKADTQLLSHPGVPFVCFCSSLVMYDILLSLYIFNSCMVIKLYI